MESSNRYFTLFIAALLAGPAIFNTVPAQDMQPSPRADQKDKLIQHRTSTGEPRPSLQTAPGKIKPLKPRPATAQTTMEIKLNVGQKLILTNGRYIIRSNSGVVKAIDMNGGVVKFSVPGGIIIKDMSNTVWVKSGLKKIKAGPFFKITG